MKRLKIVFFGCFLCLLLMACGKKCVHKYQSKMIIPPSCTEEGTETMTCTLCGHSYSQSVPVLDHKFETLAVEKVATCTEEGSQKVRCTVCGEEKNECIDMAPHTLENGVVIKPATCSDEGRQKGDCIVCGKKQVVEKIPVNGKHTFREKVIRAATCKEVGEGIKTCSSCKYSEPCFYELRNHTYTNEKILKRATCDQTGSKQFTCALCDEKIVETIDALGHVWVGATCTKPGVCRVCNATGTTASHQYKIIRETKYNDFFAGERVEECEGCGIKKTRYITKEGEVDLDFVTEEVASYARKLGFKVKLDKIDTYEIYRYMEAYKLNRLGQSGNQIAQNRLVEMGKKAVDDRYQAYASSAVGISYYTLYINFYYRTDAGLGQGWFIFYLDVR